MNKTNLVEGDTEEAKQRKEALRTDSFQSNLMKITINFLQISGIVIQYNFDWPPFVKKLFPLLFNFTFRSLKLLMQQTKLFLAIKKDFRSIVSLQWVKNSFIIILLQFVVTGNNQYINFIKLVITLIQPFVMLAGLFLVYLLYLKLTKEKIKGNPKVQKNVLVLFIITAFLLQPNIIQATLEMFR